MTYHGPLFVVGFHSPSFLSSLLFCPTSVFPHCTNPVSFRLFLLVLFLFLLGLFLFPPSTSITPTTYFPSSPPSAQEDLEPVFTYGDEEQNEMHSIPDAEISREVKERREYQRLCVELENKILLEEAGDETTSSS